MIRTLTAAQKTAMASNASRHYWLLRVDTGTPLLLTTCYKDITYNSETYLSGGFFLKVPNIDDDLDLKVRRYSFTLSAVNQANTAAFLLTPPYFKKVDLYKFWIDSAGALIGDPILRFSGYFANFSNKMDQSSGTSEMTIDAVSEFVDFERVNGRQTNDDSQQRIFSGDTCLRHSETKYENLPWGKE
jgi:hypothetical protein